MAQEQDERFRKNYHDRKRLFNKMKIDYYGELIIGIYCRE